jgi:hypothetical protein
MDIEALPEANVFIYTVRLYLKVTASLKFDLFKIGAKLDTLPLHGSCRLCGGYNRVYLATPGIEGSCGLLSVPLLYRLRLIFLQGTETRTRIQPYLNFLLGDHLSL